METCVNKRLTLGEPGDWRKIKIFARYFLCQKNCLILQKNTCIFV